MKLKNIILSTALLVGFCACDDLFEPAIENHKTVEDLEKVMKEAAKTQEQVLFITGMFPSGKRGSYAVSVAQD